MARVAINGLGRIGRAALKLVLENRRLSLVAVNDITPVASLVYLLRYDTAYGRYPKPVTSENGGLVIGGEVCKVLNEKDPTRLPWRDLAIDIVLECTGVFTQLSDLSRHLDAGAKRVILSTPAKGDGIPTVVYGVNRADPNARIISCASCTTNCITPVVEIIGRKLGVKKAIMTTVHSYTATQHIVDGPDRHATRGRAGAANFVPTTTGAAIATTKALPQYAGRFHGVAVRGPVLVGSLADVVLLVSRNTTVREVNEIFREEAASDRYRGIVGATDDPIVSSDIIGDSRASIVDLGMTQVVDGDLVKVMSWYDNEWGYTSQMVREAVRLAQQL